FDDLRLLLATVLLRRRQGRCGPWVRPRRPWRPTGVGSFPVRLRGDLVSASGEFHVRQWGVSTVRAQAVKDVMHSAPDFWTLCPIGSDRNVETERWYPSKSSLFAVLSLFSGDAL